MNQDERVLIEELATSGENDLLPGDQIRSFVGSYYRVLGWIDLVSSVIALGIAYWTGHLAITFGFVVYFWLGTSLRQGSSSARKWALVNTFLIVTLLLVAMSFPAIGLRLTPWGIGHGNPVFFLLAALMIVAVAVPAILLLGENGRRAFANQKDGEQVGDDDAEEAV